MLHKQVQSQSPREERRWNRLGETMSQFHEWFKAEFVILYKSADGPFDGQRMSLSKYLQSASSLITHLTFHHMVEENHIFPLLAVHMPSFDHSAGGRHIESHKAIHKGLDDLGALVTKYTKEPSSYSATEMRECLDGFREVLFSHLDEEVADLNAINLQKYFTLEEIERVGI